MNRPRFSSSAFGIPGGRALGSISVRRLRSGRSRLRAGTLLAGRYRLERVLGEGGMGVVYEALQEDLGRRVAIKLLSGEASPSGLQRLKVEAEVMAKLGHPHVVQITDFRDSPGEPAFLVMELLAGRSLRQLLAAEGGRRRGPTEAAGYDDAGASV